MNKDPQNPKDSQNPPLRPDPSVYIPGQHRHILHLPDEMLIEIMRFVLAICGLVPVQDRVSRVCRQFYKHAKDVIKFKYQRHPQYDQAKKVYAHRIDFGYLNGGAARSYPPSVGRPVDLPFGLASVSASSLSGILRGEWIQNWTVVLLNMYDLRCVSLGRAVVLSDILLRLAPADGDFAKRVHAFFVVWCAGYSPTITVTPAGEIAEFVKAATRAVNAIVASPAGHECPRASWILHLVVRTLVRVHERAAVREDAAVTTACCVEIHALMQHAEWCVRRPHIRACRRFDEVAVPVGAVGLACDMAARPCRPGATCSCARTLASRGPTTCGFIAGDLRRSFARSP